MDAAGAAVLDSVKEKTDEIYGKIAAGEDFAALIAEYGEDPGMQNEPTATRGYYVSAASTTCGSFNNYRITNLSSYLFCVIYIGNAFWCTFNNRNACFFHEGF